MSDKVLLVTGGGRGIGAALCRRAAAQGFRVAVNYRADHAAAAALVADTVLFLLSDAASYITATTLRAAGGR